MEFLGIGAPELLFILVLALIILGPRDMQKTGKAVGRWLNQMVTSDGWRALQRTSREIRNLPTTLMRDANLAELDEAEREIGNAIDPNRATRRSTFGPPRTSPAQKPDADQAEPSASPDDPETDA